VIELLNNAQMGSGENSKLECLKIVQEIIVHKVRRLLYLPSVFRILYPVLFDPGIRVGKKTGSGMNNEHPRSFFQELRNSF
jgi:hypothetical protein